MTTNLTEAQFDLLRDAYLEGKITKGADGVCMMTWTSGLKRMVNPGTLTSLVERGYFVTIRLRHQQGTGFVLTQSGIDALKGEASSETESEAA